MGVDLLDLIFCVEKRFEIKIAREKVRELFENRNESDPPPKALADIRVSDFVALIKTLVAEQNPECNLDIYDGVKQDIIKCLYIDEDEVAPEAWMIHELGMG